MKANTFGAEKAHLNCKLETKATSPLLGATSEILSRITRERNRTFKIRNVITIDFIQREQFH